MSLETVLDMQDNTNVCNSMRYKNNAIQNPSNAVPCACQYYIPHHGDISRFLAGGTSCSCSGFEASSSSSALRLTPDNLDGEGESDFLISPFAPLGGGVTRSSGVRERLRLDMSFRRRTAK